MNIINPEAFIKAFQDMDCGKTHVAQISSRDFESVQVETQPFPGFEFPEGYPDCCSNHKGLFRIGIERLQAFPNCCEPHKKLNNTPWFDKENYSYLPKKLTDTITYTRHCIDESIKHSEWEKEITDYLDYTKDSYGQFPDGFGSPLGVELYVQNVKAYIETQPEIPDFKKEKLVAHINSYYESKKPLELTDLNLLINKYKEWMKIFPFEMSIFSHLKPHFEKSMPILKGPGVTNIYTGLTGFKLSTKKELLSFLVAVTSAMLKEINSMNLYQNNQLNELSELKKQIILANRRVELEELDKRNWSDRKDYIKLLKTWMKGEKKFITEIKSLLNEVHTDQNFISDFLDGIKSLQQNSINAPCIKIVRDNLPDKETSFRYWFKDFFTARYRSATVTAEEEMGKGRIDLKIHQQGFPDRIIEFKGWWNGDKPNTASQICSYLSDFEYEGYVLMINHLKEKDITGEYLDIVCGEATSYIANSKQKHMSDQGNYYYYETRHTINGKEKVLFHFIFNVY